MGSTKLTLSFVLLVYTLMTITKGHCETCSSPSEKEDISTTISREYADFIETVKQRIESGKKKSKNDCETEPMDCAEVLRCGHTKSGVYTIWPKNKIIKGTVEVYCDMDTVGGGWTVIQRRGDYGRPEDYFYRDWESYKKGFGDIREDFWLGNDLIFAITNQNRYSIRFDLGNFQGDKVYALYDNFRIEDEEENYRLHISEYSGDAGEAMHYYDNLEFSTKDRDNDATPHRRCAQDYKGAWWYKWCANSNLNGLYIKGRSSYTVVHWFHWNHTQESLYTTEMKIRPKYLVKVECQDR